MSSMTGRDRFERLKDQQRLILPSMLLCDFGNLEREIRRLERAGVQAFHLDVMDGRFVPNFTYGMTIVEAVRRLTDGLLDAHLMIDQPERYAEAFADAGADVITFHVEAAFEPRLLLKRLRSRGVAAGVALNPKTGVDVANRFLDDCDIVLAMSVQPGFGGQKFKPQVLDKLRSLRRLREAAAGSPVLEVDGGVNRETIGRCVEAGAEWLVVGSAIFRQPDYGGALDELAEAAGLRLRRHEP